MEESIKIKRGKKHTLYSQQDSKKGARARRAALFVKNTGESGIARMNIIGADNIDLAVGEGTLILSEGVVCNAVDQDVDVLVKLVDARELVRR